MARTAETLGAGMRLADHLALGTLRRIIAPQQVAAALQVAPRTNRRVRDLPDELVLYYLVAMGLYMGTNYQEVMRVLLEASGHGGRVAVPVPAAITQARQRVGVAPVRQLWQLLAAAWPSPQRPAAAGDAAGWFRQWRVCSLDGTSLDVVDTVANANHFGKHRQGRRACGFPKLRAVALVENASHVCLATACSAYHVGEGTLAQQVLPALRPDMLCLADRLYATYGLWTAARKTGAALLWRVRGDRRLPVLQVLADGSYLSALRPGHGPGAPVPVRVIEYQVQPAAGAAATSFRLLCSILDPQQASATELAALFPQRWEVETTLGELKTTLRGPRTLLRSKTPALVEQEYYALLLAHLVVCQVRVEAALVGGCPPRHLSYRGGLQLLRRKMPHDGSFSPTADGCAPPGVAARVQPVAGEQQPRAGASPRGQAQPNQLPRPPRPPPPAPPAGDRHAVSSLSRSTVTE